MQFVNSEEHEKPGQRPLSSPAEFQVTDSLWGRMLRDAKLSFCSKNSLQYRELSIPRDIPPAQHWKFVLSYAASTPSALTLSSLSQRFC